jgi:hypothetical protein
MTAVRIPPVLRASTEGLKHLHGGLDRPRGHRPPGDAYPGDRRPAARPDGELNRFVNVFVNGTDVRHLQALDTPVTDRDEVVLLPAMAGG